MFKLDKIKPILPILLKDRTTEKNIIFACDQYENIDFYTEIEIEHLESLIKPRYLKDKQQKEKRQKKNAEVFTPAWLCNKMNNLVDSAWFEHEDVFNIEKEKSWEPKIENIAFPKTKSWKDYILSRRMEITCGEAPYLTSRYDSVNGKPINVENRIGLFDRKLRIVNENTSTEEDWLYWAQQALQNIYGFEYQGDNLLIARCNLFLTLLEHFEKRFDKTLEPIYYWQFAKIISWNLWQMDGLTYRTPDSSFIPIGKNAKNISECQGILCRIYDWQESKQFNFADLAIENG